MIAIFAQLIAQIPVVNNDAINWLRISRLCKALPAKRDLLITEYGLLLEAV